MSGYKIPYFGLNRQYKYLKDELLNATDEVLKSGVLVNGKFTKELERWLCSYTGAKYAVTVHSGTQALEIIARYMASSLNHQTGFPPRVVIPNITYPATLNAFLSAGWNVEIGDTDKYGILVPEYDLDATSCFVGLYGRSPTKNITYPSNYSAVIDGAQHWLLGVESSNSPMAISFDPTKNLPSSGNGGAILTNWPELARFAEDYRSNDVPDHYSVGTNSKMSELECSHILVRAEYITDWQHRRKQIRQYYIDRFRNLPIRCLSDDVGTPHCDHKFVISTENRDGLRTDLLLEGIETKIHYQHVIGDLPVASSLKHPDMVSVSVHLCPTLLSLPIYPELTDAEVEAIASKVGQYFN
jgi:dTDP-4-amino-4,6-dideoxygalactose transaminase